jgi:hypothetical protein
VQAQVLQERGLLDQAEALLPDLVTSGDDDTVKCAKKQRAQLIALRAKARDPRGVAERLGAQSTGSVVPVLLGAAVGLLVAFCYGGWRASPSRRRPLRSGPIGSGPVGTLALAWWSRLGR